MYLKDQCGQIGTRYLEFLGNTFTAKVAQMFVAFVYGLSTFFLVRFDLLNCSSLSVLERKKSIFKDGLFNLVDILPIL